MTKLFFDFEFTGLHQNTTPISLGIVSECGKTFYAEFTDYDENQVDEWIRKNVVQYLKVQDPAFVFYPAASEYRGPREMVAKLLEIWLIQFGKVEMWGDTLAYDWVLFCELFGGALHIPKNVYYIPFDLSTLFKERGYDPDTSRREFSGILEEGHNALVDARMIKSCYERIQLETTSYQYTVNIDPVDGNDTSQGYYVRLPITQNQNPIE
jgi:hypothetical protein